ncbi:MAG: hypothetical protein S4CHLAM102_07190 [Chlamydiia bacterium]|nr:hypothetical protein [Chlamydiia bacterium]
MMQLGRFFLSLIKTSMSASVSKRGAFLLEALLMVVNNAIFFSIWWIFFGAFKSIGGWQFEDMMLLTAIGVGSYGLMKVCAGGLKNLSLIIINGDLDPFMTQPKNILLHIAGSRSYAKGWGHLFSALLLICFRGTLSPAYIALALYAIFCGGLIFTSINVMAHSLAFWVGSVEHVSKKYCDSLFLFALYPTNIYSGALQLIMFTIMPAGVITYLPVQMMRNFSGVQLLIFSLATVGFVVSAFGMFYLGLKRYESGNRFGVRR